MTRFQKVFCVVLSLCFFAVLAMTPEWLFLSGNISRQLPLYRFLEERARSVPQREDPETYQLLVENNTRYLERMMEAENQPEAQEQSTEAQQQSGNTESKAAADAQEQSGDTGKEEQNISAEESGEASGQEKESADAGNKTAADAQEQSGEGQQQSVETENKTVADAQEQSEEVQGQSGDTGKEEQSASAEDSGEASGQEKESADAENKTAADAQEQNGEAGNKAGTDTREQSGEGQQQSEKTADRPSDQQAVQEEVLAETEDTSAAHTASAPILPHPEIDLAPETLADYNYLLNHFFIVDPQTATSEQQLNAAAFLGEDLTVEKNQEVPQILIYHSHSQETFADSREGVEEDTIVGVGNYLTELLTDTYGYQVLHVTEEFDMVNGQLDRSAAYDYARPYIEKVLAENPSIEVVIDLHRDGVPEDRRLVTDINGKPTAQIMFYNGLSYTADGGQVSYLPNPYIQDNLAFSFQLEYQAAQYYPELYRGIYLAALRYNLHFRPRAVLLEAGAQNNTVQEVKNAMEPFSDILNRVLTGEA